MAFREWRFPLLVIASSFIPMLPLYVIATDWGRWFSISYMAAALILLTIKRPPAWPVVALLLVITLLLTPDHGIGWRPGGVVSAFIQMVRDLT